MPATGTSYRRHDNAYAKTGLMLAGAAGLTLLGLRQALREEPDFTGQVVLITGGSRGLGLSMAEEFRRLGAQLVLLARDEKELAAAKAQLQKRVRSKAEILPLACDVSVEDEVRYAIESAIASFGGIDVLVNNAGIIQVGAIDSQTIKDFHDAMAVNFWGTVNTTFAALPYMERRGQGRIVNITSIGARMPVPHLLPYTASKYAALGFSLGLRTELAEKGISVTTIVPGLMRTGSHRNALFKGAAEKEYSWFSLGSSIPGVSISAKRAARAIVNATWQRRSYAVLGLSAKTASALVNAMPGLAAEAMSVINRVMPHSADKHIQRGNESRTFISESFLTKLGRDAAKRYNQYQTS
jgi:NAD(P)-dependent dehydrogenase (short-subunit alcohol dehydrogenase family)